MRNKLLTYSIGVGVALSGLFACSKVPDHLISEKQMQSVMRDMLMAEAMVNVDPGTYNQVAKREELFEAVFRKHGITQALYDSSLVWYGKNLDIYMQVYERVLDDLGDEILSLGDVQAEAVAASANQDAVESWPRRSYLTFSPQKGMSGSTFEIHPNSQYSSGSVFVLRLQLWGITPQMRPYPKIRLCADQGDTTVVMTTELRHDGPYRLQLNTVPTKRVRRVFGAVLMDEMPPAAYYKLYMDQVSLLKFNYASESLKRDQVTP